MQEIIKYILNFLVGRYLTEDACNFIGYTADNKQFQDYRIVIIPSDFFNEDIYGTQASLPQLPLQQWEGLPILFGKPRTETIDGTLVIHADLVASSYFLITRYEEMVRKDIRDHHHRFPGRESLPYRAGFIHLPIIELWAKVLAEKLASTGVNIQEIPPQISKVYLTHDVDLISRFRSSRGCLSAFAKAYKEPRNIQQALRSFFCGLEKDPWYTFPWLFQLAKPLTNKVGKDRCETVVFLRSRTGTIQEDLPVARLHSRDYQQLIALTKEHQHNIGLHASYQAGCNPSLIAEEKYNLEKHVGKPILYNRNHFLNNRDPDDFRALIDSGITDDFTMGYADMAGFRLGTSRTVQWIDPIKKELTHLKLHGLNIMDLSLSDKRYMHLNATEALAYAKQIIDIIKEVGGEINLLWHNNSVALDNNSYHSALYQDILSYLQTKF